MGELEKALVNRTQGTLARVSPATALGRLAAQLGEQGRSLTELGDNPLPWSLELKLPPHSREPAALKLLAERTRALALRHRRRLRRRGAGAAGRHLPRAAPGRAGGLRAGLPHHGHRRVRHAAAGDLRAPRGDRDPEAGRRHRSLRAHALPHRGRAAGRASPAASPWRRSTAWCAGSRRTAATWWASSCSTAASWWPGAALALEQLGLGVLLGLTGQLHRGAEVPARMTALLLALLLHAGSDVEEEHAQLEARLAAEKAAFDAIGDEKKDLLSLLDTLERLARDSSQRAAALERNVGRVTRQVSEARKDAEVVQAELRRPAAPDRAATGDALPDPEAGLAGRAALRRRLRLAHQAAARLRDAGGQRRARASTSSRCFAVVAAAPGAAPRAPRGHRPALPARPAHRAGGGPGAAVALQGSARQRQRRAEPHEPPDRRARADREGAQPAW